MCASCVSNGHRLFSALTPFLIRPVLHPGNTSTAQPLWVYVCACACLKETAALQAVFFPSCHVPSLICLSSSLCPLSVYYFILLWGYDKITAVAGIRCPCEFFLVFLQFMWAGWMSLLCIQQIWICSGEINWEQPLFKDTTSDLCSHRAALMAAKARIFLQGL